MTRFLNGFLQSTLTAGALFFTLLLLRRVLGRRLTGRARAALWGIPLIILLLPVGISLPQFSALRAARPMAEYRRMAQALQAPAMQPKKPLAQTAAVPEAQTNTPTAAQPIPAAQAAEQNTAPPQTHGSDAPQSAPNAREAAAPIAWQNLLPWLWGLGAAGLLFAQLLRHALFLRSVKKRRTDADTETRQVFSAVRQELGIRRSIALYVNDAVHTPFLTGVFRPALYLPQDTPQEALRYVFLHELTHHKRGDLLLQWLALFANALHFFNPAAWLLRRAVRLDCELACDETVLLRLEQAQYTEYGKAVIQMLKPKQPAPALSTAMSGSKRAVFRRVREIGRFRRSRRSVLCAALSLLLVIGVCVSALSACQPGAEGDPAAEPMLANYNKGTEMTLQLKERETLEAFISRMNECLVYPSHIPEATTQIMLQTALFSGIAQDGLTDLSDSCPKERLDARMRDYFGKLPEQPVPSQNDAIDEDIFLTNDGRYHWRARGFLSIARVQIQEAYDLGKGYRGLALVIAQRSDDPLEPGIAAHCILQKQDSSPLGYYMIAIAPTEMPVDHGGRYLPDIDSTELEKMESFAMRMAAAACTDPETFSKYREGKTGGNETAAMLSYGLLHTPPVPGDAQRFPTREVNRAIRDYFGVLPGKLPAGLRAQRKPTHYLAQNPVKYSMRPDAAANPPAVYDLGNGLFGFRTSASLYEDGQEVCRVFFECILKRDAAAPFGYYMKYFSCKPDGGSAFEKIKTLPDDFDRAGVLDLSHQLAQNPAGFCLRLGGLPQGYDNWDAVQHDAEDSAVFRYEQLEIQPSGVGGIAQFTVTYEGKPDKSAFNYRSVDGSDTRGSILQKLGPPDSENSNELIYHTKDYRGSGETIRFRLNDAGQLLGFVYFHERKDADNSGETGPQPAAAAPKQETLEAFLTRMGYSAVREVHPALVERRNLEAFIARMGKPAAYPDSDPARSTMHMLTTVRSSAIAFDQETRFQNGGCEQKLLDDRVRDYFGKLPAQPAPTQTNAPNSEIYQTDSTHYGWGGSGFSHTAWLRITKIYDLGSGCYATESISEAVDTLTYTLDEAAAHCILQKTDQGSLGYYMIAMDTAVLPDLDGVKGTDEEKYAAKLTQDLSYRLGSDTVDFCRRLGRLPQGFRSWEDLDTHDFTETENLRYDQLEIDGISASSRSKSFTVTYEGKPDQSFVNYRGLDGSATRQRVIDTLGQPDASGENELIYRTKNFRGENENIQFRFNSAGQLASLVYARGSFTNLPPWIQNH